MLDKNLEYILWLTKRLVYKYKEDPQIVNTVEDILINNQNELMFYKKTHESIDNFLKSSLRNLSEIHSEYTGLKNKEKEFSKDSLKNKSDVFENLNLDDIFK